MNFDLFEHRLHRDGYSEKPMTFLDPEPNAMLSAVTGIALIENGSRSARERWQKVQLRNLGQSRYPTLGLLASTDRQQESVRC